MAVPKKNGVFNRVKRSLGFHKSHDSEDDLETIKCVLVGTGTVGKTSLLLRFTTGKYEPSSIITIFDYHTVTVTINGKPVTLTLCDTSGMEVYDRLRLLSYPGTDVFLICFDIGYPRSLEDVLERWHPEVRDNCPNVPIILTGTKVDLRNDAETVARLNNSRLTPVTYQQGLNKQKKIGAVKYVECSASANEGVSALFQETIPAVVLAAMRGKKKKERKKHKQFTAEVITPK